MKKISKNKGFTLIELLAVIVILAVIALIATPIVIGIINDSKNKAVDNSANGILKAAEYYYTKSMLDSNTKVNGQENVFDRLEYQGEKPENGITYVTQDGKIALSFRYGDTCYKKDYFDKELTKLDYNIDTCKVSPSNEALVGGKVVTLATNNAAGLYLDNDGVYRYKGGCSSFTTNTSGICNGDNPEINNYVKINFEGADYLYRIISIEKEGIKIQGIDTTDTQSFDERTSTTEGPRNNANNTYCQVASGAIYYGCNIFAALPGEIENKYLELENPKGTVTQNSTLYDYLNTRVDAVGQVKALRSKVKQNAKWTTGFTIYNLNDLELHSYESLKKQERGINYNSMIALMTAADYVGASLNESCKIKAISNEECRNSNWLYSSKLEWTLTPRAGSFRHAWYVYMAGNLHGTSISSLERVVRPVGYLALETIFKSGTGTQSDPYTLS